MTDERATLTLADIGEEVEEFTKEFKYSEVGKEDSDATIKVRIRVPNVDEGEKFAETRQGEITSKGRIKNLPHDLKLAIDAVKTCVPDVRQWQRDRIWRLIRATGGLVSDESLVQTCYDLLGLERDNDEELINREGPTAQDFPSSSSSTSDDDSTQ